VSLPGLWESLMLILAWDLPRALPKEGQSLQPVLPRKWSEEGVEGSHRES
jgi:hypothetical protein